MSDRIQELYANYLLFTDNSHYFSEALWTNSIKCLNDSVQSVLNLRVISDTGETSIANLLMPSLLDFYDKINTLVSVSTVGTDYYRNGILVIKETVESNHDEHKKNLIELSAKNYPIAGMGLK